MMVYFFLVMLFTSGGNLYHIRQPDIYTDLGSCIAARDVYMESVPQAAGERRTVSGCIATNLNKLPRCASTAPMGQTWSPT